MTNPRIPNGIYILSGLDNNPTLIYATSSVMMIYTHSNTMILKIMKSIILGSKIDIRIILTLPQTKYLRIFLIDPLSYK